MILTRKKSTPPNPDKFPIAQLFVLGKGPLLRPVFSFDIDTHEPLSGLLNLLQSPQYFRMLGNSYSILTLEIRITLHSMPAFSYLPSPSPKLLQVSHGVDFQIGLVESQSYCLAALVP